MRSGHDIRWAGRVASRAALLVLAAETFGHDIRPIDMVVRFPAPDAFAIDFHCDPDSLLFGLGPWHARAEDYAAARRMPPPELAERVEGVRRYIERRFRVLVDGQRVPFEIAFPAGADPATTPSAAAPPGMPGHAARLTGRLPAGATSLVIGASRAFGMVNLTVRGPAGETHELLAPGMDSPPIPLGGATTRPSLVGQTWRYLRIGFEHIVPEGTDHVLFVLGLFLLSPRLRPLLWQVTAFTLAHSVSLALSIYGVVSLPSSIVEPLIALSIACVAVENIFTSELKPWRPAVVFAFGLLHGLGFAGVLRDQGLPRDLFAVALVSFNVGVELGQLAVVAAAMLVVGWARRAESYRRRVTIPASLAIACVGLFWAVERTCC